MDGTDPRRGSCFEDALTIALSYLPDDTEYPIEVCHGVPVGQGEENYGLRYWHAWAEVGTTCYVRNPSAPIDKPIEMDDIVQIPRFAFYAIGGLRNAWHVRHYSLAEAAHFAVESGHYGPWVKDDEAAAELEKLVEVG